jgi:hypothetical protein
MNPQTDTRVGPFSNEDRNTYRAFKGVMTEQERKRWFADPEYRAMYNEWLRAEETRKKNAQNPA